MTPGMVPPSDVPPQLAGAGGFPHIPTAEKTTIEDLEQKVELLRRTIALSDALLGLGNTQYYGAFVEEIQALRSVTLGKLLATKTDRDASILIGQAKALDDILSLMRNEATNRARLAATLQTMEDRLAKLTDPKKAEFLS